jgi:hypothetical protein
MSGAGGGNQEMSTVHPATGPNETTLGSLAKGQKVEMGEMGLSAEFKKYKKSNYKQQAMKAFRPRARASCIACCFGTVGTAFIAVGAVLLSMSAGVTETEPVRYDNVASCSAGLKRSPCYTEQFDVDGAQTQAKALKGVPLDPLCADRTLEADDWDTAGVGGGDVTCEVKLTVKEALEPPVFLQYQLTGFLQNHRRYYGSRLDQQLRGEDYESEAAYQTAVQDKCAGAADTCLKGAVESKLGGPDGTTQLYWCNPCGLVARSFFTDQFALKNPDGTYVDMTNSSIAWDSDVEKKFISTTDPDRNKATAGEPNLYNVRLPEENALVTDPEFIVWMRTAALPEFRKLYRVIDTKLEPGEYTVVVRNNFNVEYFEGEKAIMLATTTSLGAPNSKLGVSYVIVGVLCVVSAVALALLEKFGARSHSD